MTNETAAARQPDRFTKGLLAVFVGFPLLLFAGCTALVPTDSGEDSGSDDTVSDFEVRRQCEQWVEGKLKAPATAEFTDGTVTGGPTSWAVTGAVDAENGFGALIRTDWTCDIRLDGDVWRGHATLAE